MHIDNIEGNNPYLSLLIGGFNATNTKWWDTVSNVFSTKFQSPQSRGGSRKKLRVDNVKF